MVSSEVKVTNPSASKETAPKVTTPRTKGAKFLPNGYNKLYNADDEIWQDGTFKNGLLWEGKVYEYDRDGILLKVRVFKNGVYHSDGQL
jgi:antitoxin component YwqK of YwqJK toxin-antitoxin module